MRKHILALAIALAAVAAAAPGAGAATATFSGACAITGVSTFDPPLTGSHQIIKYDFKSGPPADGAADGTKCSGTLNGKSITDMPVQASVAGEGDLSCANGASTTPGKGELVFPDGSTFPFDFTFTAVATEVDFEADFGGTKTPGHASFLHYAPPTSVFDCSPAGSGISALGFDATTEDAGVTVKGSKADEPSGGGDAPSGGDGPTTTGSEQTTAQKRRACIKKAKKKFKKNKKKRKRAIKRCKKRFG